MSSSHRLHRVQHLSLKVLCCGVLCCAVSLASGAKLRCGSDLLNDLLFVCGDRGIYFGKGSWSGYGARPRGRGIVDQCCRPGGCSLHVLEKYCAKPKGPKEQQTTAEPTVTSATLPVTTQQTQRRLTQHLDPRRGEGHRRRASPSQRGQGRGKKWASRRATQQQRQWSSVTTVMPSTTTSSHLPRAAGSGSGS
ncbi:insulin-like growth factor 1, juvenile form [Nelusetta ayraudi]|uniref:insulin-like growth factor 1, juvenile form n=1 Tax=Nelusetta ayraudi TaxID=303726 RepID=UPI003F6E6665